MAPSLGDRRDAGRAKTERHLQHGRSYLLAYLAGANHLLRMMRRDDFAVLEPWLTPIRLNLRDVIDEVGCAVQRIIFPDSGVISVVAACEQTHLEIAMIGYEGMTGTAVVLGDDRSPHHAYVQAAGRGHAIPAEALSDLMDMRPSLRRHLLRYVQVLAVQTAQTALANGRGHIHSRLARRLLMANDRMGTELALTHEFLAMMLGVRRAGVTDAVHCLEGEGYIRARRGLILIRDRAGLERVANGFYGVPEACYRRLFGDQGQPLAAAARSAVHA